MKVIISFQNGETTMLSLSKITMIAPDASEIVFETINGTAFTYKYKDIRSIVFA